MKKIVTFVLACMLFLTALPAMADNVRTSGLYTYEIKGNGTITITDFDWDNNNGDIYLPNMIDGYTVTAIGDEAFAKDTYEEKTYSVTLPEGIKTIGEKAFFQANISAINLPSTLQQIGSAAFASCPECQFKLTVNHPYFAVIDDGLYNKANKELIAFSFDQTEPCAKITIPEGIQVIGAYAFYGIGKSRWIDLPSTLVSIEDFAFATSNSINRLSGNLTNLKSIGVYAFRGNYISQGKLVMPSVETIGQCAFYYTRGGITFDFENAPLTQIDAGVFWGSDHHCFIINTKNIVKIDVGNDVLGMLITDVSDFSPLLTTIPYGLNPQVNALPDTVTAIESGAFTEKKSDFRLSKYLKEIAVDAFPTGSTFVVDAGSYAELWCSENGFGYSIEGQDNLDWLNN